MPILDLKCFQRWSFYTRTLKTSAFSSVGLSSESSSSSSLSRCCSFRSWMHAAGFHNSWYFNLHSSMKRLTSLIIIKWYFIQENDQTNDSNIKLKFEKISSDTPIETVLTTVTTLYRSDQNRYVTVPNCYLESLLNPCLPVGARIRTMFHRAYGALDALAAPFPLLRNGRLRAISIDRHRKSVC